jgi:hypothetical protein
MPPTKDPTERVVTEIAKGIHDGNLMDIVEAVSERGADRLLWRITLDDETWDAESVTLGELRRVEAMLGKSYALVNPSASMRDFSALVVAHYQSQDMSVDEAFKKADAITQATAMSALDLYEGSMGKGSASTTS